jgi:acetylornithine deacetylase/succinyl-diaminopimelate desuccinylase-like protein
MDYGSLFYQDYVSSLPSVVRVHSVLEWFWSFFQLHSHQINPAFIADECRLWITVHYLPNESYEDVTKEIEAYLNRVAEFKAGMF